MKLHTILTLVFCSITGPLHAAKKICSPKPLVANAEGAANVSQGEKPAVANAEELKLAKAFEGAGIHLDSLHPDFIPALANSLRALPPGAPGFQVRGKVMLALSENLPRRLMGSEEQAQLTSAAKLWLESSAPKPQSTSSNPNSTADAESLRETFKVSGIKLESLNPAFIPAVTSALKSLPGDAPIFQVREIVLSKLSEHLPQQFMGPLDQAKLSGAAKLWLEKKNPVASLIPSTGVFGSEANPISPTDFTPLRTPTKPPADWYESEFAKKPLNHQRGGVSVIEHAARTGTPFLYLVVETEDGRILRLTTPYFAGTGHAGLWYWVKTQFMTEFGMNDGAAPGLKRVLGAGEAKAKIVKGTPQLTHLNETSGWAHTEVAPEKNENQVGKLLPLWKRLEPALIKKSTLGIPFVKGDLSTLHFDKELSEFAKSVEDRIRETGIDDNVRHAIGTYVNFLVLEEKNPKTPEEFRSWRDAGKAVSLYLRLSEQDGFVFGKAEYEDLKALVSKIANGEILGQTERQRLNQGLAQHYREVSELAMTRLGMSIDAVELRGPSRVHGIAQPSAPRR